MTTTVTPVRPTLTPRELFVLQHLAAGRTVKEIQPLLTVPSKRGPAASWATPGKHAAQTATARLMAKLGARTHAQLVHRAHRLGFLEGVADEPATDAPEPEAADEPTADDQRRCAWCGNPLPEGSRPHRRTDTAACRRALARSEGRA